MTTERVRFVLVRPQHPGNIGAAARAIKNMGFGRLVLVCDTPPDLEAAKPMSTHASDVLMAAEVYPDLESALSGVVWAVATTGRTRQWQYQQLTSVDLAAELLPRATQGEVAILFGQENFGLDNEAVARCQAICEIPTVGMKSLNLAQAVLIVAYELMKGISQATLSVPASQPVVDLVEIEPVVERWVEAWQAVGFLKGRNPEQFYTTLRQILGRAALEPRELEVLKGFFNKLRHYLVRTGGVDA